MCKATRLYWQGLNLFIGETTIALFHGNLEEIGFTVSMATY